MNNTFIKGQKTNNESQNKKVEKQEPHKKTGVNTVAPGRFIIGFKVIFLLLNKIINSESPQFHHNQLIDR